MKNIHILQTKEPTRIFETNTGLQFSIIDKVRVGEYKGFHIYLTSDEEIKEGDWFYDNHFEQICMFDVDFKRNPNDYEDCKLIIITTDPTLIADGVQAINDEFVEWFVKNPSCEWVDVKYKYWKEINDIGKYTYKIIIPKEEPKKETLEEAAECKSHHSEEDFIRGAKWQAERMYSEADMIEFSEWVSLNFPNQHNYLRALQKYNQGLDVPKEHLVGYRSTKELLEQFKKK